MTKYRIVPVVVAAAFSLYGKTVADADNVRRIESRFMAPCCWHENLAVHGSPIADEMPAEVARLTANGQTEEQIVDRFVARYGERILAEPRGMRLWILTVTPVAILMTALALLVLRLRRWSRPASSPFDAAHFPQVAIE
jgi:cytochrome c-type biogenesis protein CcmH